MKHVRDIDIIELTAGRLEPSQAEVVRKHVDECPGCRQRLRDIRGTWDTLGAWMLAPEKRLSGDRLVSVPDGERQLSRHRIIRLPRAGSAFRIAAAVTVTALVGYTAGRWSAGDSQVPRGGEPTYMAALTLEMGEGFSTLVLAEEPLAAEEG